MVSPTLRGRTEALDVMRGFAVLGILIANIPSFASPEMGEMTGRVTSVGLDRWLEALATVFVTGKMRSMLAILFGVGVWLQYQKRSKIEGAWPGGYLRRSLCLAVIGIGHGLFLWFGDILLCYAGMSILTAWLVDKDARILKGIIGFGFAFSFLIGVGGVLLFAAFPVPDDSFFAQYGPAFVSGTYWDQLRARAVLYPVVNLVLLFQAVAMIPLFLLGVLFGQSGVLSAPSRHARTRKAALWVGFGLGIPLNLVGLLKLQGNGFISFLMEFSGGPVLAIGLLMAGAMIVERRSLPGLAKVGRVALTTYLSQSLLASVVFYSWGFGLIGRLSFTQQLEVVAAIWAVNVLFAHLWLRRYAMGPVEWLLRSMTERRYLANRIDVR